MIVEGRQKNAGEMREKAWRDSPLAVALLASHCFFNSLLSAALSLSLLSHFFFLFFDTLLRENNNVEARLQELFEL